jgi:hypothetical protein
VVVELTSSQPCLGQFSQSLSLIDDDMVANRDTMLFEDLPNRLL